VPKERADLKRLLNRVADHLEAGATPPIGHKATA
jgi:hypothetical protein